MGDLEQHSGTITGIFLCTAGPPVIEMTQHPQAIIDQFMGSLATDIENRTDPAMRMAGTVGIQ
ncbi:hypothetical protein GCM10008094_22920 [Aidingimonas halophila]|nr:hypothetical protein GCM10008094_22920 [Aidingimonas halophila]